MKPFTEEIINTSVAIRTFLESTAAEEFKWHWDEEDRLIHMVHKTDWKLQLDNELPIQIKSTIRISKGTWHRLIKGTGDLSIIVEKIKDI